MKPAKFEYFAPATLPEALDILHQHGEDAKILAGGQSFVPLLNMRLARPQVVIDINRISDLAYISPQPDNGLAIGALTRHRSIERSPPVADRLPLFAFAMPFIAHFQIRNRGTIGGSIAHADSAAEIPALSVALDAEFVLRSSEGERLAKAQSFFIGDLTTDLASDEILAEVRIPGKGPEWKWGFQEVCRREGDFALAGVVALVKLDDANSCQDARIVMFGMGGTPVRVQKAEDSLRGTRLSQEAFREVGAIVSEELDPVSDLHASREYRKEVGGVMARRALEMTLQSVGGA